MFKPRLPLTPLGVALDGRRFAEADILPLVVVKPTGTHGLVEVRKECNPQTVVVASERTFAPGTSVLTGSHTGRPGRTVIAGPPPGQAGRSTFGVLFPPPVRLRGASASTCPVPISGKSYLALYFTPGEVHAWRYLDGQYQATIGSVDISGEPWSIFGSAFPQRVHPQGDVVVMQARGDNDWCLTMNFSSGTVAGLNLDPLNQVGGPVWDGGADMYWTDTDGGTIQLYKAPVGDSGTVDLLTAAVGDPLDPEDRVLSFPTVLCHAGGNNWQVPGFDFTDEGEEAVFAYYSGGSWEIGEDRQLAMAGIGATNGYAVSGGRSTRLGYGLPPGIDVPGTDNLGLMPAGPESPEVLLLPEDWDIGGSADQSVSPSGQEIALYPVGTGGNQLLRIQARTTRYAEGCGMPVIEVEEGPLGMPAVMLCRD